MSLVGVPEQISLVWPPRDMPPYLAQPVGDNADQWQTLDESIDASRRAVSDYDAVPVATIGEDTSGTSAEIVVALDEMRLLRGTDAAVPLPIYLIATP